MQRPKGLLALSSKRLIESIVFFRSLLSVPNPRKDQLAGLFSRCACFRSWKTCIQSAVWEENNQMIYCHVQYRIRTFWVSLYGARSRTRLLMGPFQLGIFYHCIKLSSWRSPSEAVSRCQCLFRASQPSLGASFPRRGRRVSVCLQLFCSDSVLTTSMQGGYWEKQQLCLLLQMHFCVGCCVVEGPVV